MGTPVVIGAEKRAQRCGALRRGAIGKPVGPVAQQCLNDAFRFAIGLRTTGRVKPWRTSSSETRRQRCGGDTSLDLRARGVRV